MAPALRRKWRPRARRVIRLLCGLHGKCIVEAVEVVEESNRAQQFDYFALIKIPAKLVPQSIVHGVRVTAYAFGQAQSRFLFGSEVRALFEVGQVLNLLTGPA